MSGGGAYRVSLEDLENAIERLARFEQSLADSFDQATSQANRLHATWSGAAADEHRAVQARWQAGAEQMHAALVTMRQIASTAHDNYSAAIEANTRMWSL